MDLHGLSLRVTAQFIVLVPQQPTKTRQTFTTYIGYCTPHSKKARLSLLGCCWPWRLLLYLSTNRTNVCPVSPPITHMYIYVLCIGKQQQLRDISDIFISNRFPMYIPSCVCRVLAAVYSLRWKPLISMPFDDIVKPSLLHKLDGHHSLRMAWKWPSVCPTYEKPPLLFYLYQRKEKEYEKGSLMVWVWCRACAHDVFLFYHSPPFFTTCFNENLTQTHTQTKKLASRVTFWYDRSGRKKTKELERGRETLVSTIGPTPVRAHSAWGFQVHQLVLIIIVALVVD